MDNDSIIEIPVIVPAHAVADTTLSVDLDVALAAHYDQSGIDLDALQVVVPPPPSTWEQGLEGSPRAINAADNSGVMSLITGMFVLMMLSYRNCRRLFATLFRELLGMRQRTNVFDEHTSNESQVLGLMAMQWSVYSGLLLYSYIAINYHISYEHTFSNIVSLICLTAGYYVFQLMAYNLVGYTFSTQEGRQYFVKGFTSSQSLLSFLLIIPALVAIFYPEAAMQMIIIGAILYLTARLIFIIKGFRIFYHKFSSLLYFILYLCTLEIIPLIVLYKLALSLVNSD